MKRTLSLGTFIFLVCFVGKTALAKDISLHYNTKDTKGHTIVTKFYYKNGDMRAEVNVSFSGIKMNITTLVFKKNPNEIVMVNDVNKSYSKTTKRTKKIDLNDYTITKLGKEKVGAYNCTRVKIKRADNVYDMWLTTELPPMDLPALGNELDVNKKLLTDLKEKGISGMMVKMVQLIPNTKQSQLTMELVKYDQKPLSASLFRIPANYKETKGNPNKNLSQKEKNDFVKQMMQQRQTKRN